MSVKVLNKIEEKLDFSKVKFNLVMFEIGDEMLEVEVSFTLTNEIYERVSAYTESVQGFLLDDVLKDAEKKAKKNNLDQKQIEAMITQKIIAKTIEDPEFLKKYQENNDEYNKVASLFEANYELKCISKELHELVDETVEESDFSPEIHAQLDESLVNELIKHSQAKLAGFKATKGMS